MQRSLAIAITAEISDNKLCIEIDLEKPTLSVFCKTWANEGVAMITFDSDMMSHWACRAHNYSNKSAISEYTLGWQVRLMKFIIQASVAQPWDAGVDIGTFQFPACIA